MDGPLGAKRRRWRTERRRTSFPFGMSTLPPTAALLADRPAADHNDGNAGSVVMPEARIDLLQHMPVFGGVRADILQFLLGVCPVVSVRAKEYFFREYDQADSMFVLEAGKVAVLKSWHGQEYLLGTLKEGDCFGEMAVMDLCPRSASVRAVEDCTAIRLSAANLHQVYEQDLKQFALMGPDAVLSRFSWSAEDGPGRPLPPWHLPRRSA